MEIHIKSTFLSLISIIAVIVALPNPASAVQSMTLSVGTTAGWDFQDLDTDLVKNNTIDWDDLAIVTSRWLNSDCNTANQWCSKADLDNDSDVDLLDYAVFSYDWGKQGAKNVLLQTIYGTNQDANGTIIYPNAVHALSQGKECLMVFEVSEDTALNQGWFKLTGFKAGYSFQARLYNVTGQDLLNTGHTIAKSSLDSLPTLFNVTIPTGSSVPSHTEGTQAVTDLLIDFGPIEIPAGEYMIAFNNVSGGFTIGSIARGVGATTADLMGRYSLGGPTLPKRATVTSTAGVGNTYFYYLSATTSVNYQPASNLLAFQMTTTVVNHAPVVDAGTNQVLAYPDNTADLDGTVSDDGNPDPPATLTTTWSKQSGPGTVTFGDANAVDTTATFSDFGTYILRLTAFDGELTEFGEVQIIYKENSAPVVNAGLDRTVGILDTTNLDATVTDDGLPNPPAAVTTLWTQQSGSGTATFGNASNIDTTVSFSATGTYVLRLDANDSEFSAFDEVTIEVVAGSLNTPPVVNAGNDKTITEPTMSVLLDATVTDDGNPIPPGAVTVQWTQQSGPAGVTFANANAVDTTATFPGLGTYVLRLTANDGAAEAYDEVTVTVQAFGNYEGYAPLTSGGSNGTVVHVTNLNDSGSGSLRAAVENASGVAPGTKIVFDVSGTINLTSSAIWMIRPYITIAGETAPGAGIVLNGTSVVDGTPTLRINTHDIIVRHIRVRYNGGNREIIQIDGDWNLIIDHVSAAGGNDGQIDINNGTNHITISRCIIANGVEGHRSYGQYASLHHNYYRGVNRRQPKIVNTAGPYDFRNNVLQYWTGTGTNVEAGHQVNIINNYYGPTDKTCGSGFNIDLGFSADIYISGNYFTCGTDINGLGDKSTPNEEPPVTTMAADDNLRDNVKGDCGALPRDSYDEALAGPANP